MDLSSYWIRFRSFINESIRVLKVTRKPNSLEFKTIVKVSGLGMVIIGLLGFVITMIRQLFFPYRFIKYKIITLNITPYYFLS